ncbi:type II toxin-antitoxin system VapC family toxin [Patescibacteria group bacterium]|nr:type II toxin-antitoxin system VapC family toxin [Patescibacteria group bacterium]MCG2702050.1 type II toxin-antitoxin system VapC family toxin [Candidatus Parcubacteria bacterium]MBU4265569.1 type II toxin-antitoxin system VapC family toxin [Patescibacteria group bacterium]MBU4389898.1 type II toxin-antitoxin system VapC family toxin [Patescibacteria group bacterium]MBU4397115.1 type II toxin-antitoxin system VapC family toxin [Patescibacteria group bacterium]
MTNGHNKVFLDSNILISLKFTNHPHAQKANLIIKKIIKQNKKIFISPLVLDEFIHSIKFLLQQQKISIEKIHKILQKITKEILYIPNLKIVNPPTSKTQNLKILNYIKKFKLSPRDAYHLLTITHNNIKYFATFDNDFKRVFSSSLLKPTT